VRRAWAPRREAREEPWAPKREAREGPWAPKREARRRLLIALVLAVLTVPPVLAQRASGAIVGQVVDGVTGKPIGAAVVSLSGPALLGASQPPRVLTGSDGRFVFANLDAGLYTVSATKGGYAEGEPGRRRPAGAAPPVTVNGAQPRVVTVPMWRYSAIAGVVTDEAGEAVPGLHVGALMRANGAWQWSVAGDTFTDDRGIYRFGNLVPGEYLVVASPAAVSAKANILADLGRSGSGHGLMATLAGGRGEPPGALVGGAVLATGRGYAIPPPAVGDHVRLYPPTFYPNALQPAQAPAIRLGAGEERAGVDIQIAPSATSRVSGVLLNENGPAPMAELRLIPSGAGHVPDAIVAPASITDADGRFTFAGVVPGSYLLRSETGTSTGVGWVDMPVAVADTDVDGLVATVKPPLVVAAKMRYEGTTPPPAPLGARPEFTVAPFWLENVDETGGRFAAGVVSQGSLAMMGYVPGRYVVRVSNAPAGWTFKAALLDGVDVSETPFDFKANTEITLVYTDRPSSVSGRVDGATPESASVLLFTTSGQAWGDAGPNSRRFRTARAGAQGEFLISGVPPGDYYVVAVPEDQAADWRDPAVLDSLARVATQVSIADGEKRSVALPVKSIR